MTTQAKQMFYLTGNNISKIPELSLARRLVSFSFFLSFRMDLDTLRIQVRYRMNHRTQNFLLRLVTERRSPTAIKRHWRSCVK